MKHKRPQSLLGTTNKTQVPCGKLYITVNVLEEKPFEVFVTPNEFSCKGLAALVGRLLSLCLRHGVPVEEITEQLRSCRCEAETKNMPNCGRRLAAALEEAQTPRLEES